MRTKKIINDGDRAVDEMLDGVIAAHSGHLRRLDDSPRSIVAVDGPRPGKVGFVIGGGSGHEPTFLGFVGRGLADAAAVGNVFASPPPDPILGCTRAVSGGAGVLYMYGNYAGDVMNFDMAAEMAAMEDIEVRTVLTTDDIASAPRDRRDTRRGVAGNFFVFKAAGAACDRMLDLDAVERVARRANDATFTMGVALAACSLPQTRRPNFSLGADEMEIGMGIHGEPGVARGPLQPADAIVDEMLDRILGGDGAGARRPGGAPGERARSDAADGALHHEPPGAAAAGRRGRGRARDLGRQLVHVARDGGRLGDLHASRWRVDRAAGPSLRLRDVPRRNGGSRVTTLGSDDLRRMFAEIDTAIAAERDELCRLDGEIGDADHGIAMASGFAAIRQALGALDAAASPTELLNVAAKAFLNAVGASSGPLYATAFMRAGAAVKGKSRLDADDAVAILAAMSEGIRHRGKAEPGEKTMVDAWAPAAAAADAARASGRDLAACLEAAVAAARDGAAATTAMVASKGRSARLGDRAVGHMDPGAASSVVVIDAMRRGLAG